MKTDRELTASIMRRVYGVYVMRQLTSPALRAGMFLGTIAVLTQAVSLQQVMLNAFNTSGVVGFVRFLAGALVSTEVSVQVLVGFAAILGIWFIVERVQHAAYLRQTRST